MVSNDFDWNETFQSRWLRSQNPLKILDKCLFANRTLHLFAVRSAYGMRFVEFSIVSCRICHTCQQKWSQSIYQTISVILNSIPLLSCSSSLIYSVHTLVQCEFQSLSLYRISLQMCSKYIGNKTTHTHKKNLLCVRWCGQYWST